MRKFLQEFQAFISRGNVLDLAVAVITGAAFTNIVNSLIKDIVNPILGVLVGRPDFTNLFFVLKQPPEGFDGPWTYDALTKAGATVLGYGAFLTSVVQFLLMAFTVFWMIKVVTTLRVKLESEAVAKLSSVLPGGKKEEEAQKEEKPRLPRPNPPPRCPPKRRSSCAKSATSSRPRRARNSSGGGSQGVLRASGTAYGLSEGVPSAGSRQRSPEALKSAQEPSDEASNTTNGVRHRTGCRFHLGTGRDRMTSSGGIQKKRGSLRRRTLSTCAPEARAAGGRDRCGLRLAVRLRP